MCIITQSCNKDSLAHPITQTPPSDQEILFSFKSEIRSIKDFPEIASIVKSHLREYTAQRSAGILQIDSLYLDYLSVTEIPDSLGYDVAYTFTAFIGSNIPQVYFNLYLEEYTNGTLSDPYVLMYRLDDNFSSSFLNQQVQMDSFVGAVSKHELDVMFREGARDCCDLSSIARCWEIVFGEPLDIVILDPTDPGNPGGPGSGGTNPGGRPPGAGTNPGDWDGNSGSNPGPGSGSGGSTSSGCWRFTYYFIPGGGHSIVWWDGDCNGLPDQPQDMTFGPSEEHPTTNFNVNDYTECIRLLITCEFLDGPPVPDPNRLTYAEQLALDLGFEFATQEYQDIVECLEESKAASLLVDQLLKPGALIDPCNPNNIAKTELHEILRSLCGSGVIHPNDVLSEIDDHIIVKSALGTYCPRYKCMIDLINNGNAGTPFLCDLMSGFDGSGMNAEMNILIDAADFSTNPNVNPNATALTSLVQNTSNSPLMVGLFINTLHCSNNSLTAIDIFETLQHELVHADIRRRLVQNYNLTTVNEMDFSVAFHNLVTKEYGANAGATEHAIMLEFYVEEMASSLLVANNGIGSIEIFRKLVLNSFDPATLGYCDYDTQTVMSEYLLFINWISTPGNLGSTFTSCP